jgi:hypothetical protein
MARALAAIGVWVLACAPGCRDDPPVTVYPPVAVAPSSPVAPGGPALAAPAGPRPHELGWSFAEDAAALHAVFAERLARLPAARAGLQAHADAVEMDGASWALVDGAPRYVGASADGPVIWPPGRLPHDGGAAPSVTPADPAVSALWRAAAASGTARHLRDAAGHTQVWPIVVEADCRSCHAQAAGAVLGAYLYRLEEISDD